MRYLVFVFSLVFILASCGESPKSTVNTSPSSKSKPKEEPTPAEEDSDPEAEAEALPVTVIPEEELEKAREIIAAVEEASVKEVDAKKTYKMYCATCHGFTGDLNVNGAKDLKKSGISLESRVAQLYHGRGLMTPFKGLLKNEEIVAVSKYIETLRK